MATSPSTGQLVDQATSKLMKAGGSLALMVSARRLSRSGLMEAQQLLKEAEELLNEALEGVAQGG